MTEKRQRIGPAPSLRLPPCEAEFPPPPNISRTRFITKDNAIYDVWDLAVVDSVVMAKAVHLARNLPSSTPLRLPPPTPDSLSADVTPSSTAQSVALRDNPCALPHVTAESFEDIMRYCYFHASKKLDKRDKRAPHVRVELKQWDDDFVRSDPPRLCELASAAYYLEMRKLVDLICRAIAAIISGKTTDQIRNTFDVEDDLIQSLTGMIQFDNFVFPPNTRAAPSPRQRRQGKADPADKARKPAKTFSLSAVDDFTNPDHEGRTDAPQLGTHSVDEVEKWINGPDPGKGGGKRRKKKKKHRGAAAQADPQPPDRTPTPPPSSPPSSSPPSSSPPSSSPPSSSPPSSSPPSSSPPSSSPPSSSPPSSSPPSSSPPLSSSASQSILTPNSPSAASFADPSYECGSSLPSSAEGNVVTRAQANGIADSRPERQLTNGFHETSRAAPDVPPSPEIITLSSSDDDVVLVSEKADPKEAHVEQKATSRGSPREAPKRDKTESTAKTETDATVKNEENENQDASRDIPTAKGGTKGNAVKAKVSEDTTGARIKNKSLGVGIMDGPESSDVAASGNTSSTSQLLINVQHDAPQPAHIKARKGSSVDKEDAISDKTRHSLSAAHMSPNGTQAAQDEKEEASIVLVGESGSTPRAPSPKPKSRVKESRAHAEDILPSFIRCPDDMDKEVEDFANRLNGGDTPGGLDVILTGGLDSRQRGRDAGAAGQQGDGRGPKSRQRVTATSRQRKGRGGSSANDAAGLRIMANQLEQARLEAQLLERKRHFEERATAVEKQIAALLSEREKVRDELSLVKIRLMQMEGDRNPRQSK